MRQTDPGVPCLGSAGSSTAGLTGGSEPYSTPRPVIQNIIQITHQLGQLKVVQVLGIDTTGNLMKSGIVTFVHEFNADFPTELCFINMQICFYFV